MDRHSNAAMCPVQCSKKLMEQRAEQTKYGWAKPSGASVRCIDSIRRILNKVLNRHIMETTRVVGSELHVL